MPPDGKEKGPGNRVGDRLRQAGLSVGIDFTGKTDRYPNSIAAHALLDWALETEGGPVQNRLQEVLFRHYFTDGRYPDVANLRAAAEEVGLDGAAAASAASDDARKKKVQREALSYSQRGVSGVPYFILGGQGGFSGAQPPEVIAEALQSIAR